MTTSKKVAIISINDRITLHERTARSIDCVWFKKYIEHNQPGVIVEYVSDKIMETKDSDLVVHYDKANLDDYEKVYIINSMTHFIGGDIKRHTVPLIKKIAKFNGPIEVLFTDPKLWFMDYPSKIFHGKNMKYKCDLRITEEEIELWKNLDLTALWTGSDYNAYLETAGGKYYQEIKKSKMIPLFEFVFMNKEFPKRVDTNNFQDTIEGYDICYWGDKRQGDRQKRLKKFMEDSRLKKLFIGQDPGFENSTCYKKLKHTETMDLIQYSKAALIIGDDEHNGNIVTFRFFESLKMGLITFIDRDFDPEMKLIEDDLLRKLLYVSNSNEIMQSLYFIAKNNAITTIIDAQDVELAKWEYLKIK